MTTGPTPAPPWHHDPAMPQWPAPVDEPPEPIGVRGMLIVLGACLGLGVALAVAWWLLAPAAREASAASEAGVASDGALVVLSLVLGVAHGVALVVRGGELAVSRVVITFLATVLGAVAATAVGLVLGATEQLAIVGAALMWPVAFLVVVGFAEALRYALTHEG